MAIFPALRKKRLIRRIEKLRFNNEPANYYRRVEWYRPLLKSIGERCYIKCGVFIDKPQNISIGDRVSIQHNCLISGYGGVRIGNDVSIGTGSKILSSEHPYDPGILKDHPLVAKPVVIGDNVVLGANVIILGGVTVGSNVMIGAGSIVTRDVPDNCVFAGNPARLIRAIDMRQADTAGEI